MNPSPLPACPDSWYYLGRADALAPGELTTRYLGEQPLTVYRTAQGRVVATDSHCPHLGASFASAGVVVGEELRCRMHGFCFAADGACTRTGYDTRPPPRARLRVWPTIERHGLLFVWSASEPEPPGWDVPPLDITGFSSLRTTTYRFQGHPQETTENSVDLGHLKQLHGYRDVEMTSPLHTDGAYLTASFAFSRRADFLARRDDLRVYYTVHVHGLGYSFVDVSVPGFGFRTQQFVLTRPVQGGELELTIGIRARLRKESASGVVQAVQRGIGELLGLAIMQGYKADVGQDIPIWADKRFLARPALADGDGPIGAYRRWARQFDPTTHQDRRAST